MIHTQSYFRHTLQFHNQHFLYHEMTSEYQGYSYQWLEKSEQNECNEDNKQGPNNSSNDSNPNRTSFCPSHQTGQYVSWNVQDFRSGRKRIEVLFDLERFKKIYPFLMDHLLIEIIHFSRHPHRVLLHFKKPEAFLSDYEGLSLKEEDDASLFQEIQNSFVYSSLTSIETQANLEHQGDCLKNYTDIFLEYDLNIKKLMPFGLHIVGNHLNVDYLSHMDYLISCQILSSIVSSSYSFHFLSYDYLQKYVLYYDMLQFENLTLDAYNDKLEELNNNTHQYAEPMLYGTSDQNDDFHNEDIIFGVYHEPRHETSELTSNQEINNHNLKSHLITNDHLNRSHCHTQASFNYISQANYTQSAFKSVIIRDHQGSDLALLFIDEKTYDECGKSHHKLKCLALDTIQLFSSYETHKKTGAMSQQTSNRSKIITQNGGTSNSLKEDDIKSLLLLIQKETHALDRLSTRFLKAIDPLYPEGSRHPHRFNFTRLEKLMSQDDIKNLKDIDALYALAEELASKDTLPSYIMPLKVFELPIPQAFKIYGSSHGSLILKLLNKWKRANRTFEAMSIIAYRIKKEQAGVAELIEPQLQDFLPCEDLKPQSEHTFERNTFNKTLEVIVLRSTLVFYLNDGSPRFVAYKLKSTKLPQIEKTFNFQKNTGFFNLLKRIDASDILYFTHQNDAPTSVQRYPFWQHIDGIGLYTWDTKKNEVTLLRNKEPIPKFESF